MRVLVVEDETKIAQFIKRGLIEHSYAVDWAASREMAECLISDHDYDLMILDLMLPDGSGLDIARRVRSDGYRGPILMLTALAGTQDKVRGLDAGADDYLVKPFAFEELLARVRALLRRYEVTASSSVLRCDDLEFDLVKRKVKRSEQDIALTNKEMALLEYFMRNMGRPLSRTQIIEHVWDMGFDPGSNVVDVYINMLRKKLDVSNSSKLIHTIVGQGYTMEVRE